MNETSQIDRTISIEEIVDLLENNEWTRDYMYLAVDLSRGQYDENALISLAKEKGVFHKLGYLAELALHTVQRYNLPCEVQKLESIVSHYTPPTKVRHLVEDYPVALTNLEGEEMWPLNRKWGIIGNLYEEEIFEYMDDFEE